MLSTIIGSALDPLVDVSLIAFFSNCISPRHNAIFLLLALIELFFTLVVLAKLFLCLSKLSLVLAFSIFFLIFVELSLNVFSTFVFFCSSASILFFNSAIANSVASSLSALWNLVSLSSSGLQLKLFFSSLAHSAILSDRSTSGGAASLSPRPPSCLHADSSSLRIVLALLPRSLRISLLLLMILSPLSVAHFGNRFLVSSSFLKYCIDEIINDLSSCVMFPSSISFTKASDKSKKYFFSSFVLWALLTPKALWASQVIDCNSLALNPTSAATSWYASFITSYIADLPWSNNLMPPASFAEAGRFKATEAAWVSAVM